MAATDPPALYQVAFSGFVEERLEELADEACARGDGKAFALALAEFMRLLALYPQFGDPQIDLTAEPGVIYNGIIRPLSMRYGVLEERRLVLVVAPPVLLPVDMPDAPRGRVSGHASNGRVDELVFASQPHVEQAPAHVESRPDLM